jgi:hypothetical protein
MGVYHEETAALIVGGHTTKPSAFDKKERFPKSRLGVSRLSADLSGIKRRVIYSCP